MLAIFESFRSHGYANGPRGPPAHLRIPGIWAKLYTIYDLDALDQRENAHAGLSSGDTDSNEEEEEEDNADEEEEGTPEYPKDFELLDDGDDVVMDFGELMWKRRIIGGPDEQFDGPELVKGLSQTRSLPGAKLKGLNMETEKENAKEEAEGEEEDEEEEGEEGEDEEEGEEESGEEEGEGDDDEEEEEEGSSEDKEEEETKPAKKTTKTPAKRGPLKTQAKKAAPKRRGTRRR
jgi:MRG-binding protein